MKAPVLAAPPARSGWVQRRRRLLPLIPSEVEGRIHPLWCRCAGCVGRLRAELRDGLTALAWGAGLGAAAAGAIALAQLKAAL